MFKQIPITEFAYFPFSNTDYNITSQFWLLAHEEGSIKWKMGDLFNRVGWAIVIFLSLMSTHICVSEEEGRSMKRSRTISAEELSIEELCRKKTKFNSEK